MTLDLPAETEEHLLGLVRDAMVARLAGDLEAATLVSTETAAKMLELSRKSFEALMRERKISPVVLGPRLTRWRLRDLMTLQQTTPR